MLPLLLQGSSCALAVSSYATSGVAPPALEFNEMAEPPATTAARHAARYFNNVHPVSRFNSMIWPLGTELRPLQSKQFGAAASNSCCCCAQLPERRCVMETCEVQCIADLAHHHPA